MLRMTCLALLAWLPLLAACGNAAAPPDAENSAENADAEAAAPAVPVEVRVPDRGTVYATYSGTAPIEAFAEADVVAKVAGEVRQILVEEGAEVEEGQTLARLDGDRLALELEASKARLDKLRSDYERNVNLKGKGLISEGDFDNLKFELEALEASYNLARLELDYTQIRAPIDGVVSERLVRLGNTVEVGEALFRVTSLDPLVAYLYVPEREYQRIEPGKPVAIRIDALGDTPIISSVARVSPVVDPETGTFKLTIEIADPSRRIKPGMFARIGVIYDERPEVLRIPRSALIEDDGDTTVFVVEDGKAMRRVVETGYTDRGAVEIKSGVSEGDRVVTVGQVGLKEGAAVTIIDEEVGAAATKVNSNATTD